MFRLVLIYCRTIFKYNDIPLAYIHGVIFRMHDVYKGNVFCFHNDVITHHCCFRGRA